MLQDLRHSCGVCNGCCASVYVVVFLSLQFLGPIQLYINRMLTDVKQMFFMFMVTILAFSMSLTRLFAYYQGMTRIEDGELEEQPDQFAKYQPVFQCCPK